MSVEAGKLKVARNNANSRLKGILMSIRITGIHVSSAPPSYATITGYYFAGQNGESSAWYTKVEGVAYVRKYPQTVYVAGNGKSAWVEVVEGSPAYLRSTPDGTTVDNLLSQQIY